MQPVIEITEHPKLSSLTQRSFVTFSGVDRLDSSQPLVDFQNTSTSASLYQSNAMSNSPKTIRPELLPLQFRHLNISVFQSQPQFQPQFHPQTQTQPKPLKQYFPLKEHLVSKSSIQNAPRAASDVIQQSPPIVVSQPVYVNVKVADGSNFTTTTVHSPSMANLAESTIFPENESRPFSFVPQPPPTDEEFDESLPFSNKNENENDNDDVDDDDDDDVPPPPPPADAAPKPPKVLASLCFRVIPNGPKTPLPKQSTPTPPPPVCSSLVKPPSASLLPVPQGHAKPESHSFLSPSLFKHLNAPKRIAFGQNAVHAQ
ncbi:uncharacterized protein MONOS_9690 [Monocercomonoides exilis]|uniref:uncharacterized protein n=1 Tax=Monocercomonoides exilis TaxID=2049356 RepID=UPI00355A93F1|nr:hypothetical protein MONOS_9690 [Monocercomonoides exilis]|eukprot:MONOS_9690.1-p1 / transcript=MONOS_9690.1 / gene=MONOS_9690 / organism=Monocercomonoides_exilis_PA203 / gene_product=unspecified product / transcript_product=unspecified product / location=Mono_scaffold00409:44596-45540(-) / protein_length=315 / sequence_SO=supercontig / SO=protein_coding / is_pseudo=false